MNSVKSNNSVYNLLEWDILSKKYKSAKLYLDYRYRSLEKSTLYTYVWDVILRENIENSNNQSVIIKEPIKNIVGLRISELNDFKPASSQPWVTTSVTNDLQYNIEIKEFSSNGFNGPINNYHFTLLGDSIKLVPKNNGIIWFDNIIKEMPTTLSMTFYNQHAKIPFKTPYTNIQAIFTGVITNITVDYFDTYGLLNNGNYIQIYNIPDISMVFGNTFLPYSYIRDYMNLRELLQKDPIKILNVIGGGPGNPFFIDLDIDTSLYNTVGLIFGGKLTIPNVNLQFNIDVIYDDSKE